MAYLLTYYMKQDKKIFVGIMSMLAIAILLTAIQTANAERSHKNFVPMYEDQIIVCNIDAVCKIINVDDYLSDEGTERLGMELNADIDTFSMEDLG